MRSIQLLFIFSLMTVANSYAQLRVDANGNTLVRYGAFSPTNEAALFLGDYNHYIKSKFGQGVYIGTYGSPEVIRIPQSVYRVGIIMTPSYTLDVNGIIRGSNVSPSDRRLKRDILSLSDKMDLLMKLEPISFKYSFPVKEGEHQSELNGTTHFGFIAQDVQKIYPELVYTDTDGILSVDYMSFIALLVNGYKKQVIEIEALKNEVKLCCMNATGGGNSVLNLGISQSVLDNNVNKLMQNVPNPFNIETAISCTLSELNKGDALLYVYDMTGKQIKKYEISGRGEVNVIIKSGELTPGMYLYTLVVDGKEIDTKRMILTN